MLTIILLFFGAKRISPELARSLGRGEREFHKGASEDADGTRESSEPKRREGCSYREG